MDEFSTILKIENAVKTYEKNTVLKKVSFSLERGKIYGLIGQNGAGKTTLMRTIMGLSLLDSGKIELFGDGEKLSEKRKRMGCIIETPALYPNLTAMENIEIVRRMRSHSKDDSLEKIIDMLGIDNSRKKVKNYSLGMRQKVGIAMAFIGEPELLILDEPLNGLDPVTVKNIRIQFQKMIKEKNMTILISSHMLNELYKFASDFIIIDKGIVKKIISREEMESTLEKGEDLEYFYLNIIES